MINKRLEDLREVMRREHLAACSHGDRCLGIPRCLCPRDYLHHLWTIHLPFSFCLNYPNFSDSCIFFQFATVKNLPQMIADSSHIHPYKSDIRFCVSQNV